MSPSQGPCAYSSLGLWKSTNSADEEGHLKREIGSYIYTVDLLHEPHIKTTAQTATFPPFHLIKNPPLMQFYLCFEKAKLLCIYI